MRRRLSVYVLVVVVHAVCGGKWYMRDFVAADRVRVLPSDYRIVFFIHVPKTGGSAINFAAHNNSALGKKYAWNMIGHQRRGRNEG